MDNKIFQLRQKGIKQGILSSHSIQICFIKRHQQSTITQEDVKISALFAFWIQRPHDFKALKQRETRRGLTVMNNHGPAIQSEPLRREPLMQVNHILNILISRSGGGERRKEGKERGGRAKFVPHVSWHAWVHENRRLA